MLQLVKRIARKSKFLRKVYKTAVASMIDTHIYEITSLRPRVTNFSEKRLNLLIPTINKEHLFGGIATAISFMEEMAAREPNIKTRIILTDSSPEDTDLIPFAKYTLVSPEEESYCGSQILPYNDRLNRTFPVGKNDIFIASAWWTAYIIQGIMQWQSDEYDQEIKSMIYLVQDYEPGFYPWSSHYALADSTYRYSGPQIAVFNTNILRDFFHMNGYVFNQEYVFEPKLNKSLKNELLSAKNSGFVKKKQILVYGRPSVARNAFELIVEALRIWIQKYPNSENWVLLSAGENHPDIDLGKSMKLKSLGKMSLEEYAKTLHETSIGISLMVSPHPSYPPLEMAHFGAFVITNQYSNKDLSQWHENILSLQNYSPNEIANSLISLCEKIILDSSIGIRGKSKVDFYLNESNQFEFMDDLIRRI